MHKNQVVGFMLIALILRLAWALLSAPIGLAQDDPFLPISDFMADCIKISLSFKVITAPLLVDPHIHQWPTYFREYLFYNPYPIMMPIFQEPPVALLFFLLIAKLITMTSPWFAITWVFSLYAGLVLVLRFTAHLIGRDNILLYYLFFLSFPVVFLIYRGNFTSGLTAVCVAAYLLTGFTNRRRWLGLCALVLAINFRPNVAILVLAELVFSRTFWVATRNLAIVGMLAGIVAETAFYFAHQIEPQESVLRFLMDLKLYRQDYEIDHWGLEWNDSLFGAARAFRSIVGLVPPYSALVSQVVILSGVAALASFVGLALLRRISRLECVFYLASCCVLFTPVFAEYHLLEMAAPVLILAMQVRWQERSRWLLHTSSCLILLVALSAASELLPGVATTAMLAAGAFLTPVLLNLYLTRAGSPDATAEIMLTTSVLAMSWIGGALTNQIAVSALLTSSLLVVTVGCWRRPPAAEPLSVAAGGRLTPAARPTLEQARIAG